MDDNAVPSDSANTHVHPSLATEPLPPITSDSALIFDPTEVDADGEVELDYGDMDSAIYAQIAALTPVDEGVIHMDAEDQVRALIEMGQETREREQLDIGVVAGKSNVDQVEQNGLGADAIPRVSDGEDKKENEREEDNDTLREKTIGPQNGEDVIQVRDDDYTGTKSGTEEGSDEEDEEGERGDGEFDDPRYAFEASSKRKRNRTVFSGVAQSVIEENCDRNIPCSRWLVSIIARVNEALIYSSIGRGVAGLCRMEAPILPERKKRKLVKDIPINYELGIRVQALETLIRSGSTLDPEAAQNAAMETVLHATRAAKSGSLDAGQALAQLTQTALLGGGVTAMSQDAQSSLLMEVLNQLQVASSGRTLSTDTEDPPILKNAEDIWATLPLAKPDVLTGISTAYDADDSTTKINLSLPGFREDNGKLFIPPTVRYVEKKMREENILSKETLPLWGNEAFLDSGIKFAYGPENLAYRKERIAAIQANSMIGALRLVGAFLSRNPLESHARSVYLPNPMNEEDVMALRESGLDIKYYRFLDRKNGGVDIEGMRADLMGAPSRSVILLHVSGTIPTGTELSAAQWRVITAILSERSHIPLLIMTFQGLASGDAGKDAQPLRFMAHEGLPVVLCQSFDAMMGLYSDSPALVSVVTRSTEAKERVDSQLRAVARTLFLHPSSWGAHVVHSILSDVKLYPAWLAEIKAMSDRLRSVREKLFDVLANKLKTPGSWLHLKRSTGMFCTTLLPPVVNEALTSKRHVYILPHGSISLGSLNAPKIDTLARALDHVIRASIREAEELAAQQLAMEAALAAAKEAAAREEAEAAAQAAREEDTLLMERSIASAMEAQLIFEEEERRREEEEKRLEEAVKKAAEKQDIARKAEEILATIMGGGGF